MMSDNSFRLVRRPETVLGLDLSNYAQTAPKWTLHIEGRDLEVTGVETTEGFYKIVRDENDPSIVTWVKESK